MPGYIQRVVVYGREGELEMEHHRWTVGQQDETIQL